MNRLKHTPGPWESADAEWNALYAPNGTHAAVQPEARPTNGRVAYVYAHEDQGEDRANLRLITAAPEMYAAAVRVLEAVQRLDFYARYVPMMEDQGELGSQLVEALDALALATPEGEGD